MQRTEFRRRAPISGGNLDRARGGFTTLPRGLERLRIEGEALEGRERKKRSIFLRRKDRDQGKHSSESKEKTWSSFPAKKRLTVQREDRSFLPKSYRVGKIRHAWAAKALTSVKKKTRTESGCETRDEREGVEKA